MTSPAPAIRAPALEVANLSFAYAGKLALDDVSLGVPGGGFCVLVGANGAGKTTLFSIVTGLFSAGDGRVSVRGHDLVRDSGAALAELGVVFQQSTLDADLGVRQNLRYFAELHGLPRRTARERIDTALERHGLVAVGASKAGALSGGQRRRVELARALLHRPSLLLMDEPTVGLDMASRADFVAHVRALCAEEGLGVLWATHLADEIEPADTVYLLERGRLVGRGVYSELLVEHGVDDMPALAAALAA